MAYQNSGNTGEGDDRNDITFHAEPGQDQDVDGTIPMAASFRRPSSNHNGNTRMHDDRQREHDQHAHRYERRSRSPPPRGDWNVDGNLKPQAKELKDKTTASQRPVLPSNSSIVNDTANMGKENATALQRPALPTPKFPSSDHYDNGSDSGNSFIRPKGPKKGAGHVSRFFKNENLREDTKGLHDCCISKHDFVHLKQDFEELHRRFVLASSTDERRATFCNEDV